MDRLEPEPSEHSHPQVRRTHPERREHADIRRPHVLHPAGQSLIKTVTNNVRTEPDSAEPTRQTAGSGNRRATCGKHGKRPPGVRRSVHLPAGGRC